MQHPIDPCPLVAADFPWRKRLFPRSLGWLFVVLLGALLPAKGWALPAIFPSDPSLEEYIEHMPWHYYYRYQVKNLGEFWIDAAKDCVKDTLKRGEIWEPYIQIFFHKYVSVGDHVIDLGAHIGSHTICLADLVGPTGSVFAIEGTRHLFRELVHNIALNGKANVVPLHYWISDREGVIDVDAQSNYWLSESYSPVHDGKPHSIATRTLDSFHFEGISLIKIDVECSEDRVLAGAWETIMRCRPVLIIEIMGGRDRSELRVREKIDQVKAQLIAHDYEVELLWIDDYLAVPIEKKTGRLP